MIEIVYQGETKKDLEEGYFHVPKNIRQIGEIQEERKIYIEDYVYTHIHHLIEESLGVGKMAILLGEAKWMNGIAYIFIRSSFQVEGIEVTKEQIDLNGDVWGEIYSNIKEYFPSQEIIGWFLSVPDFSIEINNVIYKTHLDHFGENDKVLFALDSLEKEENIYIYENGQMEKQKGYYIYYEQNDAMQNYLIQKNQELHLKNQEDIEDKAVQNFRKIIKGRKEKEKKAVKASLVYTAGGCVMAIAITAGILGKKYYHRETSVEQTAVQETVDTVLPQEMTPTPQQITPVPESVEKKEENTQEQKIQEQKTQEQKNEKDTKETATKINNTYIIQNGDTLSGISQKEYGTVLKVEEICELNGISKEDYIYPGQTILLP